MTGDVMFHEFIKKPLEKEDTKRKQTDDEIPEEVKIEETSTKHKKIKK